MNRTKLWQSAGSPIIQGRSKTEKPFLGVWVLALAVSVLAAVGLDVLVPGRADPTALAARQLAATALRVLPAALPSSALGTWFSRRTRLGRAWLMGGVIGGAIGFAYLRFWVQA